MMAKSPEAFRTISEVADWLGVQAHVLRFWESKFTQVKPVKRAGGRRYYRPADMLLLGGIKKLLHDDGMTIKGVQKTLREQGASYVADHSQSLDDLTMAQLDDEVSVVGRQNQRTVFASEDRPVEDVASPSDSAESPADVDVEAQEASVEPHAPAAESHAEPIQTQGPEVVEPEAPEEIALAGPVAEEPEAAAPDETVEELPEQAPQPEVELEPEAQAEPEPELEFLPESEREPEPETTDPLPSFMHKRTEDPPAPLAKVPLVVDAPDGPPEDQIDVPPGLLARVSKLRRIPASQMDQMRAAQAQLETLHTRLSGTGKE